MGPAARCEGEDDDAHDTLTPMATARLAAANARLRDGVDEHVRAVALVQCASADVAHGICQHKGLFSDHGCCSMGALTESTRQPSPALSPLLCHALGR